MRLRKEVKIARRRQGVTATTQHGQAAQNSLAAKIAAEFGSDANKAHAEVAAALAGKRKRSNSNAFESDLLRQFVMDRPNRRSFIVEVTDHNNAHHDDDDDSDDVDDQPKKRMAITDYDDDNDNDDIDEDGSEAPELMNADDIPVVVPKKKVKSIKVPRSVAKKIKKLAQTGRISKQVDMRD